MVKRPSECIKPINALVVGDFLLDTYTIGSVQRISPEAPVLILDVKQQESRPGGAGNVVLNMLSLGAHVFAAGRIGADYEGKLLLNGLTEKGAHTESLLSTKEAPTPVKHRMIAHNQQLLRTDRELIVPLDDSLERQLMEQLQLLIPQMDVLALSDYGKGVLTPSLLMQISLLAKKHQIPFLVDPKGREFTRYRGAMILKPNLKEAYAAVNATQEESLEQVAQQILALTEVDYLLITRSEAGMTLFDRSGNQTHFSVPSREVKDVTGAGDTVLAVLSAAIANRIDLSLAIQFANYAAGLVIERMGCSQVTLAELDQMMIPPPRQISPW